MLGWTEGIQAQGFDLVPNKLSVSMILSNSLILRSSLQICCGYLDQHKHHHQHHRYNTRIRNNQTNITSTQLLPPRRIIGLTRIRSICFEIFPQFVPLKSWRLISITSTLVKKDTANTWFGKGHLQYVSIVLYLRAQAGLHNYINI
jgi:hypothetical protein